MFEELSDENKYKTKEDFLLEYGPEYGPIFYKEQEDERKSKQRKPRTWLDVVADIYMISTAIFILGYIFNIYLINKQTFIEGEEYLYDVALDYFTYALKESAPKIEGYEYVTYADYDGFGITTCILSERRNETVVYLWALYGGFYEKDGEVYACHTVNEGPYRVTIQNKNKVVKLQTPYLGDSYWVSTRQLFPIQIEGKVYKHKKDRTNFIENQIETRNLKKKVKELGLDQKAKAAKAANDLLLQNINNK